MKMKLWHGVAVLIVLGIAFLVGANYPSWAGPLRVVKQ